jgi:ABC-type glycerol-3-phosphate transport system substrate-binding protein
MTLQQLTAAIQPFKGTRITAAVVGSSPPPKDQIDELAAAGLETEFTSIPATDLFQKLVVDFAAGASSFDVVTFIPNQVGAFSQFLLDLGEFNRKYQWPADDILEAFRFYGWYPDQKTGKQYGLPYDGDMFILHYRTDALQAAGLDPSKPPATYEEMAQYAAKLNNLDVGGTQVAGFLPRTRRALNHTWWANFFSAWGGDWFTADWQPRINSPEAVAALEYAVNLLPYGPPNAADLGFVEVNTTWLNGGAALSMHYQAMATSAQFDTRQSKVVDKTAVAELPAGPVGRRSAMVGGQCFGIPAKSPHTEAAYLWARWLVQPENIKRTTLAATGIDPYWRSLFSDPQLQAGWTDGKNGTRIELDQASHKTLVLPNIPEWPQLQEALDLGLSQAYVKQATPADALGSVAQAWTQTLQGAGYGAAGKAPYTPQT